MAPTTSTLRPLACWKAILRRSRQQNAITRPLTTLRAPLQAAAPSTVPARLPPVKQKMKVYPPPPSAAAVSREPIKDFTNDQLRILDPTGARTNLFSRDNAECAKVGDILLVRLKDGDPYAGVCINIRRRGIDTAILLRNQLTRVGVEMWYKIYSPNVQGIEVVQRKEKRARRARLTYMRKPKHDRGSVQNIVFQYQKAKAGLRSKGDTGAGSRKQIKGKK